MYSASRKADCGASPRATPTKAVQERAVAATPSGQPSRGPNRGTERSALSFGPSCAPAKSFLRCRALGGKITRLCLSCLLETRAVLTSPQKRPIMRPREHGSGGGGAMKAVLLTAHGGPEMLRYGDAPDPVAGPGEIVVDVHAASVNAADYKVRLGGGAYSGASKLQFPYILGRDFSGLVSALGAGVTDLAVGDAVFGVMDAGIEGCYAEKIKIKADLVAKKPEKLDHAEAAAMALTSLTAIWALEDTARLKRGETILIQGGAGGVAGFAIQLAKHIGANIVTTASAGNHDYVRQLGADRVIDYRNQDFT